jgi:hypothetical protein
VTESPASARGKRQHAPERRRHCVKVYLSTAEKTALAAAAHRDGLAPAAFIAQAATDRAEYRAAPVDAVHRAALAELIEIAGPLRRAARAFAQAAASGSGDAELRSAAANCMQAVARVNRAAARLNQRLEATAQAGSQPAAPPLPFTPRRAYSPVTGPSASRAEVPGWRAAQTGSSAPPAHGPARAARDGN